MRVLVDTSVWVDHLRAGHRAMAQLLTNGAVVMHPFVLGELACGNLKNRTAILGYMKALPSAAPATDAEVLHMIENHRLWGQGIGWIDAHLIASALLSRCRMWTHDGRLEIAALKAGVSVNP